MDQIETLISESPHFHAWPDGRPANWSVAPDVLRFIHGSLKPSMRTLETGAGQTTVAFAIAGTFHVCITPDRAQAELIRSYCREHGIKDTVTFIHESSDVALASGDGIPDIIDFVLIDGAHRFPFPILDWHFTGQRVPVDGIVAVDDYLMPSVRVLHDFLIGEDEWELVKMFQVTSFFRRKRETVSLSDWADQKINAAHVDKLGQQLEGQRRELDRLKREIQETMSELRAIKNSRVWRFYQSILPAVSSARRVSSRFRIGARSKAEASDGSN
jgi:predicted O-methyltransferase YrrM